MPGIVGSILQPQAAHTTTVQWAASFFCPEDPAEKGMQEDGLVELTPSECSSGGKSVPWSQPCSFPTVLHSEEERRV